MKTAPGPSTCVVFVALFALSIASSAHAQLSSMTAPRGTMRIELRGEFAPTSDVWINGTKRPLDALVASGGVLDASSTPLVSEVGTRISAIVGSPTAIGSLGTIATIAEWQRGTGTIGLAVGVTSRVTVYGNLPIVSHRTQVAFTPDFAGSSLGVNPADPAIGTSSGAGQTATFFAAYDAALTDLSTRIANGDYNADAARLALAQQTLSASTALRERLFVLLADPNLSSPLLPLAESAAGTALLARIAGERALFSDQLGIAFDGAPALPGTALSNEQFEALLSAPTGFGFSPRNLAPRVALGDVEIGVVVAAMQRATATSSLRLWGRAAVRLPTGEAPAAATLLDQGTGDHQLDVELAATIEASRGRLGVRAEAARTQQLAGDLQTRIGDPLGALLPARFLAAVRRDPGDITSLTVQPWFRMAEHLSITALAQYIRRGSDAVSLVEGQAPVDGANVDDLARNTAANATRVGVGLSYVHDGVGRDGVAKMPVEASLAVERTVSSSRGIVAAPLTSRVMFRVFKRLW